LVEEGSGTTLGPREDDVLKAIGAILPLALGVAISPIPIIAVILMLLSPKARTNGPAFVLGWVSGLAAVSIAVSALSGKAGWARAAGARSWAR
jgi:hypothetical protein